MCNDCFTHFDRQWKGLTLGEYLDQYQQPVLVVEAGVRAVAANQAMADLLGKSSREIYGLLGGDALECIHARLPGGCGQTTHCKTCALRNTVEAVIKTGKPKLKVPAYLDKKDGGVDMIISAYPEGKVVKVVIEEIGK